MPDHRAFWIRWPGGEQKDVHTPQRACVPEIGRAGGTEDIGETI